MSTAPKVQSKKSRDAADSTTIKSNQTERSTTTAQSSEAAHQRQPKNVAARQAKDKNSASRSKRTVAINPTRQPANTLPPEPQVQLVWKDKASQQRVHFLRTITLEKCFVIFGFLVALGMILVFGIDLATGWPFWRANISWDVAAVICGIGLTYLTWDTYRDLC